MNQAEVAESILSFDGADIGDHLRRRLQPKVPPEEIISRAKSAGEGTAPADFQMNTAAVPNPGIEIECRQRQTVQIFHHRRVTVSNHLSAAPESNSGKTFPTVVFAFQEPQQLGQGVVSFTTNHNVYI